MKTKLYWTIPQIKEVEPQNQGGTLNLTKTQKEKIMKALLKKEKSFGKKTHIDLDPVLHSQVRAQILKQTELGKEQLEHEEEEHKKEKAKSFIKQKKFLLDEIKKTIPEITNQEALQITQAQTDPQINLPSESTARRLRNATAHDVLIEEITDRLMHHYGRIPTLSEVSHEFKTEVGKRKVPNGVPAKILAHLHTRTTNPNIVIHTRPPSPTGPVIQSVPVGLGLRIKRKTKGGSFSDIISKIGKMAVVAAKDKIKSVVQDLYDKPEDALLKAFNLGKKLRELYIKETKGNVDVNKEKDIGGSFKVRIPKKHVDIVRNLAKIHPEIHGKGIWQSLVKGFTLPLRIVSRVLGPLNIPVISKTAEGFGNLSDILTDSANTKPLI